MKSKTSIGRFWAQVDIKSPDECWEWKGSFFNRYPQFWLGKKNWRASRYLMDTWIEPIPAGMLVLHRCDNPKCVNPDHLYIGTHADNTADMIARDRINLKYGTDNVNAKLSEEQVITIRKEYGLSLIHI